VDEDVVVVEEGDGLAGLALPPPPHAQVKMAKRTKQ
jgi:hypothetical protein